MRLLRCTKCSHRVFFENTTCVYCSSALGFVPGEGMVAFEVEESGDWVRLGPEGSVQRQCQNYALEGVCNWMVAADDAQALCRSCRLTRVIPALGPPGNRERWAALEQAKRRVIYSLIEYRLPILSKIEDARSGLAFDFLETLPAAHRVLTGHDNGVITLNVAEADDEVREKTRRQMREPYRTLLGHFRHETGHYYWDRLVDNTEWLEPFRELFGDERDDYSAALSRHYQQVLVDWEATFITAYASSHPWEDWAETWAHYWHIVDGLETASAWGLSLLATAPGADAVLPAPMPLHADDAVAIIVEQWLPVSQFVNAINRSLGTHDSYPFVLTAPVLQKLAFVHLVVSEVSVAAESEPQPQEVEPV